MGEDTIWFVFYQDQLMVTSHDEYLKLKSLSIHVLHVHEHFHCVEISRQPISHCLAPLRQVLSTLDKTLLPFAIKAYFILRWSRLNQFCGACGRPTIHIPPLYERICKTCKLSFFPKISPCIIVRIHRGSELLMARSPNFLPGVYGLIAGFVEPGETVEQAVHREVMEEIGIQIKHLKYFDSQPWPFPDALMLGFSAEYDSGELTVCHTELESAGWFHYKSLPGRPSNPHSIASQLIDDFIEQNNH